MKKRILFVDDEPNILSSMKRMLRGLRKTAVMSFVESGKAALAAMEDEPYDVVVSDMRMPGMDGAELLAILCKKWPRTIRIMLTGQADSASVLKTVNVVHQFLMKPCEQDEIKQTLARACTLHDFLQDAGVLAEVGGELASRFIMPDIYQNLQGILLSDHCDVDVLAACLAEDEWVCRYLVQLCSGSPDKASCTVAEAVQELGADVLCPFILSMYLFKELQEDTAYRGFWDQVLEHGMQVGLRAKQIATVEEGSPALCVESFIGGLLHDIGHLVMAKCYPEKYAHVLGQLSQGGELLDSSEDLSTFTHNKAGALLLVMFGFPLGVIEIVAYHNELKHKTGTVFDGLTAVHVADSFLSNTDSCLQLFSATRSEEYLQQVHCLARVSVWQEAMQTTT